MNQQQEALSRLQAQVEESYTIKQDFFAKSAERLVQISKQIGRALQEGKKILICGNGGSASDAQHFAGEMVGRFIRERPGLPAIALSTDTSIITAIANDYSYEDIFARQVEALGNAGDIMFAISTSGNSGNVLRACEKAKEKNMHIIALTGGNGGKLAELADLNLSVALGKNSPRIQEVHIMVIHLLVDLLDEVFLTE